MSIREEKKKKRKRKRETRRRKQEIGRKMRREVKDWKVESRHEWEMMTASI